MDLNFNKLAEELISKRRWAEAGDLLARAIREMPPGWKPVQDDNVTQSAIGDFLPIAFWDKDEWLAYSGNPAVIQQAGKNIKWVIGSYSKAWSLLAHIAIEEERLRDALLCIDQGLALEPDHPALWNQKGLILNRLKQHHEALECYRRAAGIRDWAPISQVARALRGQGAVLIDLNRLDDAERAFRQSLELDAESEVARKELEYISQVRSRLAEKDKASAEPEPLEDDSDYAGQHYRVRQRKPAGAQRHPLGYCNSCGASLEGTARFCVKCGVATAPASSSTETKRALNDAGPLTQAYSQWKSRQEEEKFVPEELQKKESEPNSPHSLSNGRPSPPDSPTDTLRQLELAIWLRRWVDESFQRAKDGNIITDAESRNRTSMLAFTSSRDSEAVNPRQVAQLVALTMAKSFSNDRFSELLNGQTLPEGWTKDDALATWNSLRDLPIQIAAFTIYNDWNKVSCLTIGGETNTADVDRFVNCTSVGDLFQFFTQYADRILGRPKTSAGSMRTPDRFLDPISISFLCGLFVDGCISIKKLLTKLIIDWGSLERSQSEGGTIRRPPMKHRTEEMSQKAADNLARLGAAWAKGKTLEEQEELLGVELEKIESERNHPRSLSNESSSPELAQGSRANSQLGEEKELCLLVTFFVSGRWDEMAGTEEEAREFVLEFIQALKQRGDDAGIRSIFSQLQQALMAHPGKWSLERIQQEPAFSEFAQQNAIRLHHSWLEAGDDGFRNEWNRIFRPASRSKNVV